MLSFAILMIPYAGIAFLWFIGVIRDQLGDAEDRLFSTVFLGSGLLFMALTFIAAALASGLLSSYAAHPEHARRERRLPLRPVGDLPGPQPLRDPHGGRLHDLAGDDLASDGGDAPAAGRS